MEMAVMRRPFRNLPWTPIVAEPPSTQAEKDAAWRASGGQTAAFKIVCRTCRLGPANGVEVFKMADGSWVCEGHR